MRAVRLCARAVVRGRWAGVVAVALLVGVGGGAVLAAVGGARRSDTAATRLYRKGAVADLEIDPASQELGALSVDLAKVRKIPQVRRATTASFFALGLRHGNAEPKQLDVFVAANADGTWIYDFDRIGLLPSFRGRMPDPRRIDEVVATTQEAQLLHVGVGSMLHVGVAKFDDPNASTPSRFTPTTLHVVGIATTPIGLLHGGGTETFLFGTPAFARRFADHNVGSTVYVQLRHPDDLGAFERQATRAAPGLTVEIKSASQELSTFSRVASPYTSTLWLFALVAGIAMVLIVSQALVRMVRADAGAGPELRALGMTAVGRAMVAAVRAIAAVLIGLAFAVIVAIAASPLFPLGLVRRVEPEPGVRIDASALGLGALIIGASLLTVIVVVSRLATRSLSIEDSSRDSHPSRIASALARMNAPVSIVGGTRLAFRRGRGTPNASTASTAASIFGLVAAIAATSAALVFGANLRQLTTPQRYGQTWDAEIVTAGTGTLSPGAVERTLLAHSLASGTTSGTFGDVRLDDQVVPSYGIHRRRGSATPTPTTGRLAARADEVAIGARTLRQLHRSIGDTLIATGSNGNRERLRIVGQTLLPSLNPNTPTLGADEGAQLTRQGLARLNPDLSNQVDFLLVDLAPHATLRGLRHVLDPKEFTVTGASPPADIASYGDVRSTPLILAGLLIALGIGVLAHLLVTSVRSSRRELAVLKTLGCTRSQLLVMVVWQALTLVFVALAAGLITGVVLGRDAWIHFATNLGLAPTVDIPTLQIIAIVIVGLVSAAAIAWVPAGAATRILPARVLRTE